MRNNEPMKTAMADIAINCKKENKVVIRLSLKQLKEWQENQENEIVSIRINLDWLFESNLN